MLNKIVVKIKSVYHNIYNFHFYIYSNPKKKQPLALQNQFQKYQLASNRVQMDFSTMAGKAGNISPELGNNNSNNPELITMFSGGGAVGAGGDELGQQQTFVSQVTKGNRASASLLRRKRTLAKELANKKKKKRRGGGLGDDEEITEEDRGNAFFTCHCVICKEQVKSGHLLDVQRKVNVKLLTDTTTQFSQLIEWLFANSDKIKGAQILFPDTVFFEDGKPSFIARVDKEGCMTKVTQASKLALQEIRQKFATIVRERRKETGLYIFNANNTSQGNNNSSIRNASSIMEPSSPDMSPNPNQQNFDKSASMIQQPGQQAAGDKESQYYKDVAIIRYNKRCTLPAYLKGESPSTSPPQLQDNPSGDLQHVDNQTSAINLTNSAAINAPKKAVEDENVLDEDNLEMMKVVKDTEFINEFKRRANDSEWCTFNCIQTVIKAKTIGIPIYIQFYAPINEASPWKEIEFGVHARAMPDDLELLKSGTPEDDEVYTQKQCYKIAHYIQKVYQQEILQMKAEFLKDDNGNIWFSYATGIQTRSRIKHASGLQGPSTLTVGDKEGSKNQSKAADIEDKEEMLQEIDEYQQEASAMQNKCIDRMLGIMDGYYQNMKLDMGIAEQQRLLLAEQEGQNDDALRLDEVLQKLRPNTTAKNFKEFLLRSDNINKTTHWKKVSRKLHPNLPASNPSNQQCSPNKRQSVILNQASSHGSSSIIVGQSGDFKTSILNAYDPREHRLRIQNLLSSFEHLQNPGKAKIQNFLTSQSGINLDMQPYSQQRIGTAGTHVGGRPGIFKEFNLPMPAQYQPLSPTKSMFFGAASQAEETITSTTSLGDRKHRTQIKAELVRKELLSRSDLIRLYQPPIPKAALPTCNPFYTKTIVNSSHIFSPYQDVTSSTAKHNRQMTTLSPQVRQNSMFKTPTSQTITDTKDQQQQERIGTTGHMGKRLSLQMSARSAVAMEQKNTIQQDKNEGGFIQRGNNNGVGKKLFVGRLGRQSMVEKTINNDAEYNEQQHQMLDWSKYQGNRQLQRQIMKRMEYLKVQDTFKPHQGTQDCTSFYANG